MKDNKINTTYKEAAEEELPAVLQFIKDHPAVAVVPTTAAVGAKVIDKRRNPIMNALRGGTIGAATGAGALAGHRLGSMVSGDSMDGTSVGGGALGGLLAYLAAQRLVPRPGEPTRDKYGESPLTGLLQAKQLSDTRAYTGKHAKLRGLIEKYPQDFFVDSVAGNIIGITHRPTNFRIHAPKHVLPVGFLGDDNGQANSK